MNIDTRLILVIQHVIIIIMTLQQLALHQQVRDLYGAMSEQVVSWRDNFWAIIQRRCSICLKTQHKDWSILTEI
jgi:hypothetical protein